MLATGAHSVLVFVQMQFRGSWTRSSGANQIIYTSNAVTELIVVTEDANAVKTTYFFKLERADEVWVERNVVHIPTLCIKSVPGNEAKCEA